MRPRLHFEQEHDMFRDSVQKFLTAEMAPQVDRWREQGHVDRAAFRRMGEEGYLCMWADEAYGGLGITDLRFEQVLQEETVRLVDPGFFHNAHSKLVGPYLERLATDEQKARFLPGAVSGETILGIALTEPDAGSDLAAIRTRAVEHEDHWVLNGAKTYISNGVIGDLFVTAARTGDKRGQIGLFVVTSDMEGFSRGRHLKKIGLHAQDTAELRFDNIRIPKENVLADPGRGFTYMAECLAVERLMSAITSIAHAQAAFEVTTDFILERRAFGKPIAAFQNTRFRMAEMRAELDAVQSYVDRCVTLANNDRLSPEAAAAAKLATSETEGSVIDQCAQFHGGAGYMDEYRIARMYADARISRVYAGASEIMLEIVGRGLGLGERDLT
ncbi:acyl-CoA dehydrogenase family protein [Roseovarius indicus]|uniref:Acyl-CoA dehydrogenase n=1 Tax=Roseovarius indicus TaxID=540747 RepID=A0A0T5PB07_9RHOB|nr:acyl-CoA dehydrogenase family protein [Roseovarius indicus]KRS18438.1 acyl-CoA dehydrogenase [Roseovarius indicus]QEW25410.1 Acyl-CoA dehydrogenase [Roseovarius indicus]SFE05603.1 acyl-CoA dehydrogenase [Roseovarius indicus]